METGGAPEEWNWRRTTALELDGVARKGKWPQVRDQIVAVGQQGGEVLCRAGGGIRRRQVSAAEGGVR